MCRGLAGTLDGDRRAGAGVDVEVEVQAWVGEG